MVKRSSLFRVSVEEEKVIVFDVRNETGAPMKPLAKLTVNRQRLYRKSCNDEEHIL